ncbi:MAG: hypothetical protein PVF46_05110 [Lysobacterales bacterium]|jgi:hypothetical protein
MRKPAWLALLGTLLVGACVYDVPFVTEHDIPIDQAILGTWEIVSEEDDDEQLRILRFSDTEYLVCDVDGEGDELYFRAYAIEVGGISAVQLEFLGDNKRPVRGDNRYLVASYRFVDGLLEVRTLNVELVDDELTDSESLRAAFMEHKENPELFNNPGLFKRVTD